jgi:hypothetical protein
MAQKIAKVTKGQRERSFLSKPAGYVIFLQQVSAGFVEVAGSGGSPHGWDARSWDLLSK